jgi:hypothetical protein
MVSPVPQPSYRINWGLHDVLPEFQKLRVDMN